jgi:hypothetical protein
MNYSTLTDVEMFLKRATASPNKTVAAQRITRRS